jgi:hypothetical protein
MGVRVQQLGSEKWKEKLRRKGERNGVPFNIII